jgi:hypothetical protein
VRLPCFLSKPSAGIDFSHTREVASCTSFLSCALRKRGKRGVENAKDITGRKSRAYLYTKVRNLSVVAGSLAVHVDLLQVGCMPCMLTLRHIRLSRRDGLLSRSSIPPSKNTTNSENSILENSHHNGTTIHLPVAAAASADRHASLHVDLVPVDSLLRPLVGMDRQNLQAS